MYAETTNHSCNELYFRRGGNDGKACGGEEVMKASLQTVNYTGL